MRKPTIWVPTRSDTTRAVQSQKKASGLMKKRKCTIRVAKTKDLISFAVTAASLFSHMQIVDFLVQRLISDHVKEIFTSIYAA